jgi:RimJ/RimL family protein N-acetyltransferase
MTGAAVGRALPLPEPPLADEGLRLRPWTTADAPALAAAWADPEIACWTGVPPVRDVAAALRWIEGDARRRAAGLSLDLVVEEAGAVAGEVAGEVGLVGLEQGRQRGEVGWWIGPDHRGRGLATRAVRLLVGWALGPLGVGVLEARCHPDNPASGGVAEAAGFTLVDGLWRIGPVRRGGKVSP